MTKCSRAFCKHPKMTHDASGCSMCTCSAFKEGDLPSKSLFKKKDPWMDSDGDSDGDDDSDD